MNSVMNMLVAHVTHVEATSFMIVFTLGVVVGAGIALAVLGWSRR